MKLSARIRNATRSIASSASRATAFVLEPIGFREILLFVGCGFIWWGLAPVYLPAAFIVPGSILAAVAVFGVR